MRDEPLIELETDKVTVEVPSPADGVLREIFKQEQDEVAPGDRLGRIDVFGRSSRRRRSHTVPRSGAVSAIAAKRSPAPPEMAGVRRSA